MLSDCCGVVIYRGDICSRCKEHCEPMVDSEREYNETDDILWNRYPLESDDGYDAARDAYEEGYGPAVTRRQIEEDRAWQEECRRNRW